MQALTPREIVAELDKYIIGQDAAKRAVAIALRNRWRWQQLPEDVRRDIMPKNIIMIGPTGVGKTEITRRFAKLTDAPFIKIEATKYTEVGYYGRDVESMVRDLVEAAIAMVREKKRSTVQEEAARRVEERLLDLLIPAPALSRKKSRSSVPEGLDFLLKAAEGQATDNDDGEELSEAAQERAADRSSRTRERFREKLRSGDLEDKVVDLRIESRMMPVHVMSNIGGMEQMEMDLQNLFEKIGPKQTSSRSVPVRKAREILLEQELESLMDKDAINEEAVKLAETHGVIFIDEIDKICGPEDSRGPDVSRSGVQRDLLPIVEGTTVQTKYGYVKTDQVLFIAAGAFHRSRPSDLMPELQGRFPIRVELQPLTRDDFIRILTEPKSSLTRQYQDLLGADTVKLKFTKDGIESIADIAFQVNQTTQNIGARRLHTILERLLEDISFEAPDVKKKSLAIDGDYVRKKLQDRVSSSCSLAL
ncbi:MAG: ATP-dependent HslUV protease ATP-binding subunit HslU [Planctomycetota bacterium]|nr:MAG: ATP-dependent HslUV protease ATP-binding subunit HslU [Planctomycetota bacterium]